MLRTVRPWLLGRGSFVDVLALVGDRRLLEFDGPFGLDFLLDFIELQVLFIGLVEQLEEHFLIVYDLAVDWRLVDVGAFQPLVFGNAIEQPVEHQIVIDVVSGLDPL